jgi:hypothetical protein
VRSPVGSQRPTGLPLALTLMQACREAWSAITPLSIQEVPVAITKIRETGRSAGTLVSDRLMRLWARCLCWSLDAKLAGGIDPASESALAARAEQLLDRRSRLRLARDLRRLVTECDESAAPAFSAAVPVVREQVAAAREMLLFAAEVLCFADRLEPRGVAMLTRLLRNGDSAIYVRGARGALLLQLRAALDHLVVERPAWADAWFLNAAVGDGGWVGHR